MKLATFLGRGEYQKGEIGLEIETETREGYVYVPDINKYWRIEPDGSLRNNGVEYIFAVPYNFNSKQYTAAMTAFDEQVKATKFLKSVYSSVHVHLNMNDKTMTEMMNFITLYYLFEEILVEYCGNDRNGNLFCLKTSNAEQIYKVIRDMAISIENGKGSLFIGGLQASALKYSGLNICPLRTQGSLEVRTHPGTVSVDEINRWVSMLHMLYTKAGTYRDPVEIVNRLQGYRSKRAFAELHFEEYSKFLNLDNLEDKMKDAVWYASSLAGAVQDWKGFGSKKVSTKLGKETAEAMATYYRDVVVPNDNPFDRGLVEGRGEQAVINAYIEGVNRRRPRPAPDGNGAVGVTRNVVPRATQTQFYVDQPNTWTTANIVTDL